jgi:outer membrane protein OmpA-like peptidoglycan-associated protein
MKRTLLPLLILLLWFLGCLWWWSCRCNPCKKCCAEASLTDSITTAVVSTPTIDTLKHAVSTEEQVLFKPLEVYFATGQSSIKKDSAVTNFLTLAKAYLAKHPDEKMLVTGHTDGDGSEESNVKLSLKRANKMQGFLVSEGFTAAQMETTGKGEAEPLAPNDTQEGKDKNRRVTVILKQ